MKAALLALTLIATLAAAPAGSLLMRLDGRWEIARGHADGRFRGASVRDYHPGDVLDVLLNGVGFRVYGVTGPTGGRAQMLLDHTPVRTIDFYSPAKRTDVLLYASPALAPGIYTVDFVISPAHDAPSRGTYVNVDKIEVVR